MRWFCKCVETWWPVLLDEIICMTRISWITQSVISFSARPDGGDGEMEARARSGLQDGRMVLACLGYCLPPPWLPCWPSTAPHGYFINIIMSWILKDFSQQENRGLLCHDLAIYPLWQCHYVPPPHSLLWRELIENGSCSLELLRIMSGPL